MRRAFAVLLLIALSAAACTGGSGPVTTPEPDVAMPTDGSAVSEPPPRPPVAGGTVRVRAATEPDGLNPWAAPADDAVSVVTRPVLAPLWRIRPDGELEPWLLAGEPEVRTEGDGTPTVVYEVRDDAFWSDGQPIDGGDVLFTLEACRALPPDERDGQPCGAVDLAASRADGRRATVAFTRPVGTWRALLADLPVLPEHLLDGRDVTSSWSKRVPVSSGPFRFASWTRRERIVLVRNDRWWGEPPALDRIEVVFDGSAGVAELLDGTIDVAAVDATLSNVERVRATTRLRVAVDAGRALEALDFNVASPRVGRAAVREALAAALDLEVLVDEVIRPIVPATRPRRGLLVDTSSDATAPTEGAGGGAGGLEAVGCGTGAGGVAVCDGTTMRLVLDVAGGSWQHQLVAEYVTSQLADVGVEVAPAGDAGAWDMRVEEISAVDPVAMAQRWRCDGPANDQAYCNPALDDLLDRAERLPPGDERDAVLAGAELMLSRDRPTYPLYPVPEMLAYRSVVRGPAINSGPWGLTWNTEEWARTTAAAD
jgi:peptide/nickel transport system substrate-binding protein